MTGGAVAAGSPLTVQAGLRALEMGGNAVDAAVAAQLMACVAEPLLTGLGGSGMAMVKMNGTVECIDFFSSMPGMGRRAGTPPAMTRIEIDFGPTTQIFHVGPASVAVPGTPDGIWMLHQRHGRLPMRELVTPAVQAAQMGVDVDACAEVVFEMLWPIESMSQSSLRLAGVDGSHLRKGDVYRSTALAPTLEQYAAEGPEMFRSGDAARALLSALGEDTLLTLDDLQHYRPVIR